MVKTAVQETQINTAYLVEEDGGPLLPWLQANDYEPRGERDEVKVCAPEAAVDLLTGDLSKLKMSAISTFFGNEQGLAYTFENARWVVLCRPDTGYAKNRDDGSIIRIYKGLKFGSEWTSISRLYLACLIDGKELMLDDEGEIQVWQMKLTGLKSNWIRGKETKRSIHKLNEGLCKHYKVKRGWLTHLVSIGIAAFPHFFKGKEKESWGTMFGFDDSQAKPLSEENQKAIFELISTDEFKEMAADPFNLAGKEPEPKVEAPAEEERQDDDTEVDDIPF